MAAAALALVVANSPLAGAYDAALHAYFGPASAGLRLSVLHWINDGLMAGFFLLVGLEIKREVLEGELSTPASRVLPTVAALGGVIVPAAIFLALNGADPDRARGWAIPSATDIAFALGVLALAGPRVPVSLKVLLTAIAIIDDLAAIVIIAVAYTAQLNVLMLVGAGGVLAALFILNRMRVTALWPYLLLGVGLWWLVLQSGVHATLAGVALAMAIPLQGKGDDESPLHRLEHNLHWPVAFLIVPVFGFANAGLSLAGVTLATVLAPVPLGVALGLFLGKQVGVFATAAVAIRMGWAELPEGATLAQVWGVAVLCGVGFTMSLFIGNLAFADAALVEATRIGVLGGSLAAAVLGLAILRYFGRPKPD